MATTTSYASMHDNEPREGDITYYGIIKDIIELSFNDGCKKIILFECDWADNNKNKIDRHGFTLVDFTRPNRSTCPFILPSLVLQAFFVPDPCDKPWVVPIVTKSRDTFELSTDNECLEIMPIRVVPIVTIISTDDVVSMEE